MIRTAYHYVRRQCRNFMLRRKYEGLVLDNAHVVGTELGRFNLICNAASISNSTIGDYSYAGVGSIICRTTIGKFCSIGPGVTINPGLHPTRDFVTMHPAFYSMAFRCQRRFAKEQGFVEHGHVEIGHDVWIGANAIITPGVKIGSGAVVGAGAIVTKDVEPFAVVGGVPARTIRFRFEPEQIETLLDSQWWDWSLEKIEASHTEFRSFKRFEKLMESGKDETS